MKKTCTITILMAGLLAGCGSGSEPVPPAPPVAESIGASSSTFSASYDAATDAVTFVAGTATDTLTRTAALERNSFRIYVSGAAIPAIGMRAQTASGEGTAGLENWPDAGREGSVFARLSDTLVPASGRADFTGDYAAIFGAPGSGDRAIMFGDAALTADFDSATISGQITNRFVQAGAIDIPANDLLLAPSTISDGAFNGTTSGGAVIGSPGPTTTTASGVYTGLVTGANGEEVVGAVLVTHSLASPPPPQVLEYGAFVANRSGP